jgi:isovaleryl-CoA dehydrogenase
MATGEIRATMALTEPGGGSDLQAMRTVARRDGEDYVVNGSKTWISNARRSDLVALMCKTDLNAQPAHSGVSLLLVEKGPGFEVSRDLPKLGYKGVESCELSFTDFRTPVTSVLGGAEGAGFAQMMRGLEIGRIQVASRALGVGRAALEDALRYAQERESFGQPIWKHQSIGNYLADMATKLTAARQLVLHAARQYDTGRRAAMEAGMAKLFASEAAMQIALDAVRVFGGYGYSTEFDVERYFRDAPLMIVGGGPTRFSETSSPRSWCVATTSRPSSDSGRPRDGDRPEVKRPAEPPPLPPSRRLPRVVGASPRGCAARRGSCRHGPLRVARRRSP